MVVVRALTLVVFVCGVANADESTVTLSAPAIFIPAGSYDASPQRSQLRELIGACERAMGEHHMCQSVLPESLTMRPQGKRYVPAFHIDRFEVSVGAYKACVRQRKCSPQPFAVGDAANFRSDSHPMTWVSHAEAQQYCQVHGGSLPQLQQWERAAGSLKSIWPWGNRFRANRFNYGKVAYLMRARLRFPYRLNLFPPDNVPDDSDGFAGLTPATSQIGDRSPYGVQNMAGNVSEWTATAWPPKHVGRVGVNRAIKGGSWLKPRFMARVFVSDFASTDYRAADLGFRCVSQGGQRALSHAKETL